VIETERLLLRPLTDDDIDDAHRELYSDPEVTWSGRTFSREEAVEGIASKRRHFEEHGFGMLAVTDKATGELFGWGGLQYMEGGPEVELGYYLARKAWGKGYATELSRPFMELAFTRLGLERVVAVVRPGNEASKNVLAKVGFSFVAHEHHYDQDVELWEARPDSASDAAVAAAGAMTEALETLERARGHLYAFHQLVGEADLKLDEVLDQLRANGSSSLAGDLERELLGRNVIEGRWTFQIVEEFDDGYWTTFRAYEQRLRHELVNGRRHLQEAEMKQRRRTHGHPAHSAGPE
jgi:RimJ/RimL family protein N-acetyltransferase